MRLSVAPLLMHNEAVPTQARTALRKAFSGPPEARATHLKTAARALYLETDLDCQDVREIVGLESECSCE